VLKIELDKLPTIAGQLVATNDKRRCRPSGYIICGRPPSYALHCAIQLLTLTLTSDLLNWKLAHRLLQPRETFTYFKGFSTPFVFDWGALRDRRTTRQTDVSEGRTDGRARLVMRPIDLQT